MGRIKDDNYYIEKLLNEIEYIEGHMKDTTYEEFIENELLIDAMSFRLVQIHENAKELSEKYQEDHSLVPWGMIKGLRNRIVHDYGSMDYKIIYDTLYSDVPKLGKMIKESIK